MLAAAAERTKRIQLTSAVTVLSSDDPVRVYQQFATLDLLSGGRAEIMAGRGSFIESFPLFGYDLNDYDALFAEKLELLLKIRDSERVTWSGEHRAPLQRPGRSIRARRTRSPIWVAVGGNPPSAVRAGTLGLPMALAIIGGMPERFAPFVDLFRQAAREAGHDADKLPVGINTHGYVADTSQRAADEFFPSYAAQMTRIGRERGWPPTTRAQFDAGRTLRGAPRRRQPGAGDREDPVPARGARPPALSDADERRHHAARADHALDRAVRHEGRAGGAQGVEDDPLTIGREATDALGPHRPAEFI